MNRLEFDTLPKPDAARGAFREMAFLEIFRPAIDSGEKLNLAKARNLLSRFNERENIDPRLVLSDVFYGALKLSFNSVGKIRKEHLLAMGFLALDDLNETLPKAGDANVAFVMEAEIRFIENYVWDMVPWVRGTKGPKGFLGRILAGGS